MILSRRLRRWPGEQLWKANNKEILLQENFRACKMPRYLWVAKKHKIYLFMHFVKEWFILFNLIQLMGDGDQDECMTSILYSFMSRPRSEKSWYLAGADISIVLLSIPVTGVLISGFSTSTARRREGVVLWNGLVEDTAKCRRSADKVCSRDLGSWRRWRQSKTNTSWWKNSRRVYLAEFLIR